MLKNGAWIIGNLGIFLMPKVAYFDSTKIIEK